MLLLEQAETVFPAKPSEDSAVVEKGGLASRYNSVVHHAVAPYSNSAQRA